MAAILPATMYKQRDQRVNDDLFRNQFAQGPKVICMLYNVICDKTVITTESARSLLMPLCLFWRQGIWNNQDDPDRWTCT